MRAGRTSAVRWPGALKHRGFRRLYLALVLSSFGDWLGFLATTAFATQLVDGFGAQSYAVGGVLAFRLLPAVLLGPVAGVLADRFDRRRLMVVTDLLRFVLFVSIPVVHTLWWLLVATVLVEVLSLFWIPAKEASVPNLVGDDLESANQLSLVAAYGTAPLAAVVYGVLGVMAVKTDLPPADVGLYVDGLTFLFAAVQVARISEIPRRSEGARAAAAPSVLSSIREGLAFARSSSTVRGVLVAMLGALAAAGTVVANGKLFATTVLAGGDAAYALLFGAVFVGIALGVALGPKALGDLSRRRALGPVITAAGACLVFLAVVPVLALVVLATLLLGAFAGLAYVLGLTLLGTEANDEVRGRTFGLVNSLMRIDLLVVLAVAPPLAGAIGQRTVPLPGDGSLHVNGIGVTMLVGGLLAVAVGLVSYRTMDDRKGVPLRSDLWALLHRGRVGPRLPGLFVAFEGGEGGGKSTQVETAAAWLAELGCDVVCTREPGSTTVGARLRELLLDPASELSSRAEALLYAADRAQHVDTVIRPALERGAVVVTDRYVDSSLAYQGAGRDLKVEDVAKLSGWATGSLRPDLVVLLDVDPAVGLARAARTGRPDRMEAESLAFHARVRQGFLDLAAAAPDRYLVIPADQPPEQVARTVRRRLEPLAAARAGMPAGTAA
ncbi:MAG TPA: dTMP kinase [Mycobacteriales bacterium]|jgi:dTMP kinase|nr:dTMP kinase [Mycobacteriales bacterium]